LNDYIASWFIHQSWIKGYLHTHDPDTTKHIVKSTLFFSITNFSHNKSKSHLKTALELCISFYYGNVYSLFDCVCCWHLNIIFLLKIFDPLITKKKKKSKQTNNRVFLIGLAFMEFQNLYPIYVSKLRNIFLQNLPL